MGFLRKVERYFQGLNEYDKSKARLVEIESEIVEAERKAAEAEQTYGDAMAAWLKDEGSNQLYDEALRSYHEMLERREILEELGRSHSNAIGTYYEYKGRRRR